MSCRSGAGKISAMRIVHLINHVRFGWGNVHAAIDLACAQAESGDEVMFAAGSGEFAALLAERGIGLVVVEPERRHYMGSAKSLSLLWRLVGSFKPDVMHAHMMASGVIGSVVGKLRGVPLVTTVHNAFDSHSLLMGLGDRVIAVSAAIDEQMARRGIARSKLRTVLNATLGTPRRDFFARQEFAIKRPSVGTLCGLHDRKGISDLIAAFALCCRRDAQAELFLAGAGPHQPKYERQVAGLGLGDRIHFVGPVHDTKSFLNQIDIFVLASHAEPFGLVLTEAREAGCALIGTDVDGIPEVLEQGQAGVLVPPKDPPALAAAILTLLLNPERLAAGKAASSTFDSYQWSTKRVAAETRAVYQEVVRHLR